jgi:hypothetical protein
MGYRISFIAILLVAGCATVEVSSRGTFTRISGTEPEVGMASTANVGEVIIKSYNYLANREPDHFRTLEKIDVKVGVMMKVKVDPETRLYQVSEGKFCIDNYGNDCLYDADGDNRFERASSKPGLIVFDKQLDNPVEYRAYAGELTMAEDGGFQHELIYLGRDGNTLRVRYREYKDNLARPAFTQDLTYPIGKNNISHIVYRNLSIEVKSVELASIQYSIVEGNF